MIAWEIGAKRALANPVHNDSKTDHPLKNHTGVGITHTLERHVIPGTVHIRMDTRTEPYEGLLGRHSLMKLNGPLCRVDL